MRLVAFFLAIFVFGGCGKDKKKIPPNGKPLPSKQVTVTQLPKVEPSNPLSAAAIEAGIRAALEKPEGELTLVDFENVKSLYLPHDGIDDLAMLASLPNLEELSVWNNNITNLTPLAGLTKLRKVIIYDNPNLTRTEINKLKSALPECVIRHNSKKF